MSDWQPIRTFTAFHQPTSLSRVWRRSQSLPTIVFDSDDDATVEMKSFNGALEEEIRQRPTTSRRIQNILFSIRSRSQDARALQRDRWHVQRDEVSNSTVLTHPVAASVSTRQSQLYNKEPDDRKLEPILDVVLQLDEQESESKYTKSVKATGDDPRPAASSSLSRPQSPYDAKVNQPAWRRYIVSSKRK